MEHSASKSLSTSNINLIGEGDTTPTGYVTNRIIKRKRSEDKSLDFENFKEEMKEIIKSFMVKQESESKTVSSSIKDIRQTVINIESSLTFLSAQNEDLKKKLDTLEIERRKDRDYISILEDRLEDSLRQNRKTCIEIKNVPNKENETKEDLLQLTSELSKTVKCEDFSKNAVKDIYRIKTKEKSKNIIVELTSTMIKTDLIAACKSYNYKNKSDKLCAKHLGFKEKGETPIYVSEQLTPKAARLYFLARDLSRTQSYKFCWTSFGKVFVRKDEKTPVIPIVSEAQIQKLYPK
ncbi:hypothetical protein JYU34_005687 [Plutella xylostella]|uniref:FP protein C-terminal domain-containing protein n=1 Tax=Plutella xylostella TaxID=51655 RepID=A0ABQ7QTW6_PLUXY|nr:uncharacterized protein LOC125490437 [Plutella xylostella]KAG7300116.1 hypothetical protein JYU34_015658 [Plutella xylostella]KAG7308477.1 hypothetical protein JYU34_005687 [Plutella xylostella]